MRRLSRLLGRFSETPTRDQGAQPVELAAAVLMIEVARADQRLDEKEAETIRRALATTFELANEDLQDLIDLARQRQQESVDLYSFTRTITSHWLPEARFELLVQLWRLALADAVVDKYEEATIRKIADLIHVDHQRFIAAKIRAKQLSQPSIPA